MKNAHHSFAELKEMSLKCLVLSNQQHKTQIYSIYYYRRPPLLNTEIKKYSIISKSTQKNDPCECYYTITICITVYHWVIIINALIYK